MLIATLNAAPAVANRVGAALGLELGLKDAEGSPRNATIPEYENWLRDVTRRMVMGVEDRENRKAVPPPASVDIT